MIKTSKLALCLAGGGVKGIAHVGALKALEEQNIAFEYISGTSSGSIVTILSSVGYRADEIYELFKKYSKRIHYIDLEAIIDVLKRFITTGKFIIEGLNSGRIIERSINEACKEKGIYNINQIKKSILIPSVDLDNGKVYIFASRLNRNFFSDKTVYIDDINIGKAVRASCSYPGVFCPCRYNGRRLVDGGIRENVPWKEWKKMGIDKVLCIGFETEKDYKKDKNMVDIISNSLELLCHELSNYELDGVDYLLKIKTKDVSLLDTKQMEYLYREGYKQTKAFLNRFMSQN